MMSHDDLAWKGAAKPHRSGGMVTSVGLNTESTVFGDGQADPGDPGRDHGPAGPAVQVEPLGPAKDDTVRPNGRLRIG
jgi:hypothetical protein